MTLEGKVKTTLECFLLDPERCHPCYCGSKGWCCGQPVELLFLPSLMCPTLVLRAWIEQKIAQDSSWRGKWARQECSSEQAVWFSPPWGLWKKALWGCEVSDPGQGCNITVLEDINLNSALPSCKLFPSGAACTAAATHFVSQTPDCQATSHKHALSSSDWATCVYFVIGQPLEPTLKMNLMFAEEGQQLCNTGTGRNRTMALNNGENALHLN